MLHGSVTMEQGRNPCFYVITWDAEYHVPLNVDTYYLNITEANLNPSENPKWRKMHDLIDEYNLKDLSPSSMLDLTNRLYKDYDLETKFEMNWNRGGIPLEPHSHSIYYKCLATSDEHELTNCMMSHYNIFEW